jgi:hypothetical protein
VEVFMKAIAALIFFCLLPAAALHAQGVYVTPGAQGPMFSDRPQPGAREISLPPLTIVEPPPEAKAAPTTAGADDGANGANSAAAPAYRSFKIVSPENDGSVLANTAIFEVRLAVDPPLQFGVGHFYSVSINGRPVGQRFTANEFMIPPEFWGDTLPPANQSMQLDASILDLNGQVLRKAAPVRFQMRQANVFNQPKPHPHPQPLPGKPAAPRAKPESAIGATSKPNNP